MNIIDFFSNLKFEPSLRNKGYGIYVIYCSEGNKIYIGSSKNIYRRWKEHRSRLKKGNHPNIHLQRIFNKYGMTILIFMVIELTHNLQERESHFIEVLKSTYEVINVADPIRKCTYKTSDEFKMKRSELMKGNTISKGIKHTDEARKNISEGHKQLWKEISDEQKRKWVEDRSPGLRKSISKITIEIAKEIKQRLNNGERPFSIAKSLNIKPYFVMNIKNGSSWKDA